MKDLHAHRQDFQQGLYRILSALNETIIDVEDMSRAWVSEEDEPSDERMLEIYRASINKCTYGESVPIDEILARSLHLSDLFTVAERDDSVFGDDPVGKAIAIQWARLDTLEMMRSAVFWLIWVLNTNRARGDYDQIAGYNTHREMAEARARLMELALVGTDYQRGLVTQRIVDDVMLEKGGMKRSYSHYYSFAGDYFGYADGADEELGEYINTTWGKSPEPEDANNLLGYVSESK
jgi:hypothetical protein